MKKNSCLLNYSLLYASGHKTVFAQKKYQSWPGFSSIRPRKKSPRCLLHFAITLTISGNFCPYAVDLSSSTSECLIHTARVVPSAYQRFSSSRRLDDGSLEEAVEIINTFLGGANSGTSTFFFLGALALVLGSFSLLIQKRSPRLFFSRAVRLQVFITSGSVITVSVHHSGISLLSVTEYFTS